MSAHIAQSYFEKQLISSYTTSIYGAHSKWRRKQLMGLILPHCNPKQDIDYEGFKLFMDTYLEVEVQDELCRRLFLSFVKRTPTKTNSSVEGKVIKVLNQSFHICILG